MTHLFKVCLGSPVTAGAHGRLDARELLETVLVLPPISPYDIWLYMGSADPNSAPQTCLANALSTELYLQAPPTHPFFGQGLTV